MNNSLATQVKTPMAKAPQKQPTPSNDEVKEQRQESSQITKNQATHFSSSHSNSFNNSAKSNFFQARYSSFPIQTKLTIGSPSDKYEREADAMANRIMRLPQSFSSQPMSRGADTIQRKCAACENEEENIRRKPLMMKSEGGTPIATPALGAQLSSSKGSGQPLPQATHCFMSNAFGADFSGVRIHTGNKAVQMNQGLNARAFTHGSDVYFNSGQYNPGTGEGKRLLAHELTHTIQQGSNPSLGVQRVPSQAQLNTVCYTNSANQPNPSAKEPELHPTYELWLASFVGMQTFTANDTAPGHTARNRFTVLGAAVEARRFGDNTATTETEPVPVTGRTRRGEEFIDHPTNQWVVNCLPPNLRATAYQLPSDCADIAVILRHVWLSAHHRTEQYNGWTVGDAAGGANQRRALGLIRRVGSENVRHMVSPYSDPQGNHLMDFNTIANLLHPGDVLVWEHRETYTRNGRVLSRRTGGHTQTITQILRTGNTISRINVLQGNLPIFGDAATEILRAQGRRNTNPDSSEGRRLRHLPARRIESEEAVSISNITRPDTSQIIWGTIDERRDDGSVKDFTTLVAAGPPRAAARPATRRISGQRVRRISDWFQRLKTASANTLPGVLEAALLEGRSIIDGGNTVSPNDLESLGRNAGENLWARARSSVQRFNRANSPGSSHLSRGDVGNRSHFETLRQLRATIRALGGIHPNVYHGNPSAAAAVRIAFSTIDREFDFAARGGSTVSFNRRIRRGAELVKVLVTGFDPFGSSPPQSGDWNPSGSAALILDGEEVSLGGNNKASVESVVYPVSFEEFRQGIVERVVRTANADAVLTVSLDGGLAANGPVQIEQFTAGVHNLQRLQSHRLFPPAQPAQTGLRGVPGGGEAIIRANTDLNRIAGDTEQRNRQGNVIVQRPSVATGVVFSFSSIQEATQVVSALGLNQRVTNRTIVISNELALARIMSNIQRVSDSHGLTADIDLTLNKQIFRATVTEGPGGNFLSNEVAFRTQRFLRQQSNTAISFHTHTPHAVPGGTRIPATGNTRRTALWAARNAIRLLVTTLRRIIRAVGNRVLGRRQGIP